MGRALSLSWEWPQCLTVQIKFHSEKKHFSSLYDFAEYIERPEDFILLILYAGLSLYLRL